MKFFVELVPILLKDVKCEYILSEVFSQDPLEIYFSRQRYHGGSRDNPSVLEFCNNTATLIQQRIIYRDDKTMNVKAQKNQKINVETPLPKRKKMHVS